MEDKYMIVWDTTCLIGRRLVIKINEDGSCLAIQQGHEEAYKKGEIISLVRWEHCEEIEGSILNKELSIEDERKFRSDLQDDLQDWKERIEENIREKIKEESKQRYRPLTIDDHDVDLLNKLYRINDDLYSVFKATAISREDNNIFLKIDDLWRSSKQLFKRWETLYNDEWHPVGKKI